jgi:hypothetical protein
MSKGGISVSQTSLVLILFSGVFEYIALSNLLVSYQFAEGDF